MESGLAGTMLGEAHIPTGIPDDRRAAEWRLVQEAQAGDLRAFERLYRENERRVFALCMRLSSNPELAEELRPALLRIGERIATLLVALSTGLPEAEIAAACRDGLRSPWLNDPSRAELVGALYRVSARASKPATSGSATQTP